MKRKSFDLLLHFTQIVNVGSGKIKFYCAVVNAIWKFLLFDFSFYHFFEEIKPKLRSYCDCLLVSLFSSVGFGSRSVLLLPAVSMLGINN